MKTPTFLAFPGIAFSTSAVAAESKQKADALAAIISHQAIIDQRINDAYFTGGYYLTGLSIIVGIITIIVAVVSIIMPIYFNRQREKFIKSAKQEKKNFVKRAESELAEIKSLKQRYTDELVGLRSDGGKILSNDAQPLAPPTTSTPGSKEDLLYQGNKAHMEGHYDVAIEIYNKLLAIDPNASVVYNNIAFTYAKQGKYDEALKYYDLAIAKDAYNVQPKYSKGEVLFVKKMYNAALKCFDEILQIRQDANVYNYKGLIYEKQGDFERSLACYRKAYELAPNILIYKQNILGALLLNKQVDIAVPLIKELDLTVPSAWSAKMLGHVELLNGNFEEAEKLYNLALSRVEGSKEKLAALNFISENDLQLGKKSFPDKKEAMKFMEEWINAQSQKLGIS